MCLMLAKEGLPKMRVALHCRNITAKALARGAAMQSSASWSPSRRSHIFMQDPHARPELSDQVLYPLN